VDYDYLPIKFPDRTRLRASLIFSFVITTTMIGISMGANLVGAVQTWVGFQLGAVPWFAMSELGTSFEEKKQSVTGNGT
jgi:hypothetical protein